MTGRRACFSVCVCVCAGGGEHRTGGVFAWIWTRRAWWGNFECPSDSPWRAWDCGSALCLAAQACPTLCDPMGCGPPGSSVHGASPGKNTGVGCLALIHGMNPGLLPCRRILYILTHQGSVALWLCSKVPRWRMRKNCWPSAYVCGCINLVGGCFFCNSSVWMRHHFLIHIQWARWNLKGNVRTARGLK